MLESVEGVTINGNRLSSVFDGNWESYLIVNEVRGRSLPTYEAEVISVPSARDYETSKKVSSRTLEVDITIKGTSFNDLRRRIEKITDLLTPYEDSPIVFDDEPDRTYFGRFVGSEESLEKSKIAKITLTFMCYDPHKYGTEKTENISSSSIYNEGTAEAYPVFDLEVTEDSEIVKITNLSNLDREGDSRSILFGTEKSVDEVVRDRAELVMHDTMNSTSGWTGASDVDNGRVTGQMGVMSGTSRDGFYVENWGDDNEDDYTNEWIGPSLKRDFDKPLKGIKAEIDISNVNYIDDSGNLIPNGVGIIEVYFRDINGEQVCKMQFGDVEDHISLNHFKFSVPGKEFVTTPPNKTGFNDFNGQMRLIRDSDYFYPEITKKNDNGIRLKWYGPGTIIPGKYDGGDSVGYNDIKTIQVAMRKWVGAQRITMRIKEIKVWDYIGEFEYPDDKVVEKLKTGDRIHIDTSKGLVMLNGEARTDLVHLSSDFFKLKTGDNQIDVSGNVTGTVSYTNRYL